MKTVSVTPNHDGEWMITARGFGTQEKAITQARRLSKTLKAELIILGVDGQIREKDSHGHDPEDIPG